MVGRNPNLAPCCHLVAAFYSAPLNNVASPRNEGALQRVLAPLLPWSRSPLPPPPFTPLFVSQYLTWPKFCLWTCVKIQLPFAVLTTTTKTTTAFTIKQKWQVFVGIDNATSRTGWRTTLHFPRQTSVGHHVITSKYYRERTSPLENYIPHKALRRCTIDGGTGDGALTTPRRSKRKQSWVCAARPVPGGGLWKYSGNFTSRSISIYVFFSISSPNFLNVNFPPHDCLRGWVYSIKGTRKWSWWARTFLPNLTTSRCLTFT